MQLLTDLSRHWQSSVKWLVFSALPHRLPTVLFIRYFKHEKGRTFSKLSCKVRKCRQMDRQMGQQENSLDQTVLKRPETLRRKHWERPTGKIVKVMATKAVTCPNQQHIQTQRRIWEFVRSFFLTSRGSCLAESLSVLAASPGGLQWFHCRKIRERISTSSVSQTKLPPFFLYFGKSQNNLCLHCSPTMLVNIIGIISSKC